MSLEKSINDIQIISSEIVLTYITASSSVMELRTSKPANLHSPLRLMKTELSLKLPWIDLASSLMKDKVFYIMIQYEGHPSMLGRKYCDVIQAPF